MPKHNTGYPAIINIVNREAYQLGCALLDLQDRLLTRDRNKKARAVLELDKRIQMLRFLSYNLSAVVRGRVQCATQVADVLNEVKSWNLRLELLTTRLRV